MIARIIPLKRLPRRLSFFDYRIPEQSGSQIQVGQLVTIPFRSSIQYGIIFEIKEDRIEDQKKTELKELASIVIEEPIVSAEYLSFVCEMAELYGVSAGTLLKMSMMPAQKRKLRNVRLTKLPALPKKTALKKNALIYENETMHAKSILENIKGKTLILVPEIYEAEKIYEFLPDDIKSRALVWHSKLSTKEQFDRWFRIRNGEPDLIIGTRAATLLPFFKLDTIIIDYEHDENHKQSDQAPRFHVKDVVDDVASIHGAELIYMSYTLSLNSYYQIQKKALPFLGKKIEALQILFKKKTNSALIFERTAEVGSKNFAPVNPALQQKLLEAVDRTEDIFIFINRKDEVKKAITNNKEQKFGITTHMIEHEIVSLLKSTSYQIIRLEKDIEFKKNAEVPCAIIGTEAAFPHIDWQKTGLIIYLDLDRQLAIAEINATEHVWGLISRAHYCKRSDADFIIQTKIPEHVVFRSMGEPDRFYRTELSHRQEHNYPPYCYMVRYYFHDTDYEKTQKNATMVRENIKSALTNARKDCTLTNLFELYSAMVSKESTIGFAIKFPDFDRTAIKMVNKLIPDTWKIDPGPVSLTSI